MKIGDKIYKYLSFAGFVTYKVIAIKTTEKATLYEVECLACNHTPACTLYVVPILGRGAFRFVCMTMANDEESEEQEMWHSDEHNFYKKQNEAKLAKYQQEILRQYRQTQELEERLKQKQKQLKSLEEHYLNVKKEVEAK